MRNWHQLVLTLACSVAAAASQFQPEYAVVPGTYIVELEDGVSSEHLIENLASDDFTITTRKVLSNKLFNGVSIDVGAGAVEAQAASLKIAANAGVKKIWPVRVVSIPGNEVKSVISLKGSAVEARSLERRGKSLNETYGPHAMMQVDRLHEAGFTGKGAKIGILDTGVDYNHPDLGGCFGPDCIVSYGANIIGKDDIFAPDQPLDDPMDCHGHGTHVAGILAAKNTGLGFYGIVPDAKLGAYKVIDCRGRATEEAVIAGLIKAFEDGSDIITMSLGLANGWPDGPLSTVAKRIVDAGVPIFAAAGNDGDSGLFFPNSPADARGVNGVANFYTPDVQTVGYGGEFSVDGGEPEEFGWLPGSGELLAQGVNDSFPLFDLASLTYEDGRQADGCEPLPEGSPNLGGLVVLLTARVDGNCNIFTQQENIVEKGGSVFMFYGPGPM
jgi:subtilisin family serine protease